MKRPIPLAMLLFAQPALAEEGMWLLNGFPREAVQKKYGFTATDAWLRTVQASSVRLARGCSASFVSATGLVMTNHHCVSSCVQENSTAQKDLMQLGFYAKTQAEERPCPGAELNVLMAIDDVTARINAATQGLDDRKFNETLKAEMSTIEKACAQGDRWRCEVVTLYHGGQYHLYRYQAYRDFRLVFVPEFDVAFFGGDPDNFMFPRYDLDLAFVRAYENGQPAKPQSHFRWSRTGAKEGELTFVTGHPGNTQRLLTVAELEFQRDVELPDRLLRLAEARGNLTEFSRRSSEHRRIAMKDLFYLENSLKSRRGMFETLVDKDFFSKKVAAEQALRAAIAKDPVRQKQYGHAWDEIARAVSKYRHQYRHLVMVEKGQAFPNELFFFARTLVRGAEEKAKPNEKRLREFRESALPSLEHQLFSAAPIYPELEEIELSFGLVKLREVLGPDDPLVRKVLGKEAPEDLARTLVAGSKLESVGLRRKLWEGGKKAIEASDDPLIKFARSIDPDARALRRKYEDEIEAPSKKNSELVAKATFAVQGTSSYPDATFTLRLSYGTVKGHEEGGRRVLPFTQLGGAFERHTGKDPFALPPSWLENREKLALGTPFNQISTHDIIGGNSGSPMINKEAEVVGLVFDTNIHGLGLAYGYQDVTARTVSVHPAAIVEALEKIYGASRIAQELIPPRGAGGY